MTDWGIHTGDALEVLRTMPDESVDAVITDPPLGTTSLPWDQLVEGWSTACSRVLKKTGSLWCFGSMSYFISNNFDRFRFIQDIVWEKHNGSNPFADRFRRVHEIVAQFVRLDAKWSEVYKSPIYTNDACARTVRRKRRPPHWGSIKESFYKSEDGGPRLMRSVFFARSCHGSAEHPTQKPVSIIAPLIEYSCPPGGMVLDPFAGSGSVGVAAKRLGRHFIGIELDPHYAQLATRRIEDDMSLFNTQELTTDA